MLNMSIERYLNEQQLLGNRITLNNAELQELLTYIVANVPRMKTLSHRMRTGIRSMKWTSPCLSRRIATCR